MSLTLEIRNLAKSCNFCDCLSDSLIRDRIVMGVYDAGTRKHLLQAATHICRSDEAATAQMKSISDSAQIHRIKKSHSGGADKQNSAGKPGNSRGHRIMQRKQNATYIDGDARVNSVDELTHRTKTVVRHGGERVEDAGEETTSQTAARWQTYGGQALTHR